MLTALYRRSIVDAGDGSHLGNSRLDELIHVTKGAQNALLDLEELEEDELDRICEGYQKIAERARGELRNDSKRKCSAL
jgi:low affinity Fe/Cu permease